MDALLKAQDELVNLNTQREKIDEIVRQLKTECKGPTSPKFAVTPLCTVKQFKRDQTDGQRNADCSIRINKCLEKLIEVKLREQLTSRNFSGVFLPIGSSRSATDVGKSADFDYLYEISDEDISVHDTAQHHTRYIHGKYQQRIYPIDKYKEFSKVTEQIISKWSDTDLPHGLRFGGFAYDRYSGVRHCEPAVTALFRWVDPKLVEEVYEIPVDITLAYRLPMKRKKEKEFAETITNIISEYAFAADKDFDVRSHLHLVPVLPEDGKWYITTADLETYLMRALPIYAKDAIRECKRFKSCMSCAFPRDTYLKNISEKLKADIANYRHKYPTNSSQSPRNSTERDECRCISQLMANWHVLLTKSDGDNLKESCTKSAVSINSSAIKFTALNLLRQSSCPKDCQMLAKAILQQLLVDPSVQHTLLCYDISVVTVACHAAMNKDHMYHCCTNFLNCYIEHKYAK